MKNGFLLSFLLVISSLMGAWAQSPAHSYFTILWKDGKAWFISPTHRPFLSMGVNSIKDQSYRATNELYYDPVKNQYSGNKKAWIKGVLIRLKRWHFNTIGCWGDEDLLTQKIPFTYMTYIGRGNPWDDVLDSVFTPEFEKRANENAQKIKGYMLDPNLVGYFLDNELPWWGEYGWKSDGQETLLQKYALRTVDDSNKEALEKFFQDRYQQDIEKFDDAWGLNFKSFGELDGPVTLVIKNRKQREDANAWAGLVAERYFSVTTHALKEVDPNHLILGVRFAGSAPWEVVEACGKYCDVVSVNLYAKSGDIDRDLLDNFYAKTTRPILVSEYSFSAMENQSGDPNSHGADVAEATQKDRAEHLDRYVRQGLALPYIVGLHWYEWADESPKGRFDGEDCNYGLVDIKDHEYSLVTKEHAKLNLIGTSIHIKSDIPLPAEFKPESAATYRKAESDFKVPSVRPYLKMDSTLQIIPWGDEANGGKISFDTHEGVIALDFDSGSGWGCGASLPSNVSPFVATNPTLVDLRGYNYLDFKAFVPQGLTFILYMSESGVEDPSKTLYPGVNGADGESYSFPPFLGTGKWEDYRVDFSELERRTTWGNQHGNHILDLQALKDVEIYVPGNQGSGRLLVKDMEFKVK